MTRPMSRKTLAALARQPEPCADCGTPVVGGLCDPCKARRKDAEMLAARKAEAKRAAKEKEEIDMEIAVAQELRRRRANAKRPLGTWSSK